MTRKVIYIYIYLFKMFLTTYVAVYSLLNTATSHFTFASASCECLLDVVFGRYSTKTTLQICLLVCFVLLPLVEFEFLGPCETEQVCGDLAHLDLLGPFGDTIPAEVSIDVLERLMPGITIAAMYLSPKSD